VAEHLTQNSKIESSNPGPCTGTERIAIGFKVNTLSRLDRLIIANRFLIVMEWPSFDGFGCCVSIHRRFNFNLCRVRVGQIFKFVKLILFLKLYLGGGLPPPCQTIGSILIPLVIEARRGNDLSLVPMDLTNSKIQPIWTSPKTYCARVLTEVALLGGIDFKTETKTRIASIS
jgi:hypothetical protein